MQHSLHNTAKVKAERLVRICSDWNITETTLHQFFGEEILQQDWFSRSLQAWCLESNALSFLEDSARFRRKRRQRQPSITEAPIRDWRPNDIDSCLNDLLTERIRMGHGWQGFPTCLPERLKIQGRLRDRVPLLKGYEHLSSICKFNAALPLLLSQRDTREPAHFWREDGTLGGHQARTISSTQTISRKVLGEVDNPPAAVASPQPKVVTVPTQVQRNRAGERASARAIGEALKVALENISNVVEGLEEPTQALVHKRNPKGFPMSRQDIESQSKYLQMISSCRGWETYTESLPPSWGSPLSQAAMIRLYRLAQLCTSGEAEPLLQQQLRLQNQTKRLSLLSIEAVRQTMMAAHILCDMSTRDPGDIILARARTATPDLDHTESAENGSDSVFPSDHGFLDDYEPDADAGHDNHHQADSSMPGGSRGVQNAASQVDFAGQLESEAVPELAEYFDFITANSIDPGQLYYEGQLYEAAQSGSCDETGLMSQNDFKDRPEVVADSRKRKRADSAIDFDSYVHHNVYEQFPNLELELSKTPWCPAAGHETRQTDALPIYIDPSYADGSPVLELAQCDGGQWDLDAWMGIF